MYLRRYIYETASNILVNETRKNAATLLLYAQINSVTVPREIITLFQWRVTRSPDYISLKQSTLIVTRNVLMCHLQNRTRNAIRFVKKVLMKICYYT